MRSIDTSEFTNIPRSGDGQLRVKGRGESQAGCLRTAKIATRRWPFLALRDSETLRLTNSRCVNRGMESVLTRQVRGNKWAPSSHQPCRPSKTKTLRSGPYFNPVGFDGNRTNTPFYAP